MDNKSQLNIFDYIDGTNDSNAIKETIFNFDDVIPNEWLNKLNNYNLEKYCEDINSYGIETTWKYICNYSFTGSNNRFLNISNFGELYEIALALEDKQHKKDNGQYYTPDDVATLMANWFDRVDGENICDVACGTGKLILTYFDIIGEEKVLKILEDRRLFLYDLDKNALKICLTAILVKYGKKYLNYVHAYHCDFLNRNLHLPQNCKVISNPPYAGIISVPKEWSKTTIQLETKELYSSFMEKIISESVASVIITPYSFVGGNKFYSLRCLLNNYSGFIVSFDNVPGNIFCGRKHGIFNTNTSNSVRASIIVTNNIGDKKGFKISPLIRFKNEERNKLLVTDVLESTISNKYQIVDAKNKAYVKCHISLEDVFYNWTNKSKSKLNNFITNYPTKYNINIPNTCRYFTTASNYKLNRTGMMSLYFNDKAVFEFIYCLINSSFAYWWWRIFDGGITYSSGLLGKLPIFIDLLNEDDKLFFEKKTKDMIDCEKDCIVKKLNAGIYQENIKFPSDFRTEINDRLLKILGFTNLKSDIFNIVHKNSFFGNSSWDE